METWWQSLALVLAGSTLAWVGAWLSDRRSERSASRDRWRSDRLQAYAEFLQLGTDALHLVIDATSEDGVEGLLERMREVKRVEARIRLLGSETTREAAHEYSVLLEETYLELWTPKSPEDIDKAIDGYIEWSSAQLDEFQAAVRRELDVETIVGKSRARSSKRSGARDP